MKDIFQGIVKAMRIIIGGVTGFVILAGGVVYLCQGLGMVLRFSKEGVFAPAFLGSRIFIGLAMISISSLFLRFCFGEKLRDKIGYGQLCAVLLLTLLCGGVLTALDERQRSYFDWPKYSPEVKTGKVRSLYGSEEVDYSDDKIVIDCYESFITDGFRREEECVQVVEDPSCTDKIKVEVYYRGEECELYLGSGEEYAYISLRRKNYSDDNMTTRDWVYMYKNKVDIEYCDKYAIEKLVIHTAYPDKIDTSEIYFD